jgi:hypothetical protein
MRLFVKIHLMTAMAFGTLCGLKAIQHVNAITLNSSTPYPQLQASLNSNDDNLAAEFRVYNLPGLYHN